MSFRFIHAADLHLDTPFEGVDPLPNQAEQLLRDASLDAFDALIHLTLQQEAAFLLIAGDCYDGLKYGLRAQKRFLQGMERLAEKQIPVFIARGKNDPAPGTAEDWPAVLQWPPNVTLFDAETVRHVEVEYQGRCIATVHGIGYSDSSNPEGTLAQFAKANGRGLRIGLIHQEVSDAEPADHSDCWRPEQLKSAGIDYWALGHHHAFRELSKGPARIVYPGTIQGRGFGPAEQGAKGAVVVDVGENGIEWLAFKPLDQVRTVTLPLNITTLSDAEALRPALADEAHALQSKHEERALLIRAKMWGKGQATRLLAQHRYRDEMLQALRSDFCSIKPFIWWERLEEESTDPPDLERIRRHKGLVTALLSETDNLAQNISELDALLEEALAPIAEALGKVKAGFLAPTAGAERILTLLAVAEARALAHLDRENA